MVASQGYLQLELSSPLTATTTRAISHPLKYFIRDAAQPPSHGDTCLIKKPMTACSSLRRPRTALCRQAAHDRDTSGGERRQAYERQARDMRTSTNICKDMYIPRAYRAHTVLIVRGGAENSIGGAERWLR